MRTITQQVTKMDALISAIQKNQSTQSEITQLYELLFPFIVLQIRKHRFRILYSEPEELANDIFTKLYFKLDKYIPTKGSIYSWVKTITKNALIDIYRTQRAERCQSLDLMLKSGFNCEILGGCSSPEAEIIRKEQRKELLSYMKKLTDINRELFYRFYFENKSVNELANEWAITCNAVSVRLFRAKKMLSGYLT